MTGCCTDSRVLVRIGLASGSCKFTQINRLFHLNMSNRVIQLQMHVKRVLVQARSTLQLAV